MKHILLVEDDRESLEAVQQMLCGTYKVTAAHDGAQALKFLETGSSDLILLDISRPEMNGCALMETLKKREDLARIPVVILTTGDDVAMESRFLAAGAADFITKPIVPVVIRLRIRRILEAEDMRHRLENRLEEKIREVSAIRSKAQQDALTGLWNRVYTEEMVNTLASGGVKGAIFMIDMDNFKAINDNYGHIAGDNVLKGFAETMRQFSQPDDILCRLGGDEFIMFVNRCSDRALGKIAADIIAAFSDSLKEKNYMTNSSVSIGIAMIPEDGQDFETVYNAADKALYYVKQNGKNSYRFYNERRKHNYDRERTHVDLQYLQELIARSDSPDGAYMLDLGGFQHVYNFIRRFMERAGHAIQVLLFTAYPKNGVLEQGEVDKSLDLLEQSIFYSLRRSDIYTRYSSSQIIVILMDANSENCDMVAKRILDYFETIYLENHIGMEYSVAEMKKNPAAGKPSE